MSENLGPRAGAEASEASGASEASEASEASGAGGVSIRVGGQSGRPIGVSPSPTPQSADGTTWWAGNKWPPVAPPINWSRLSLDTDYMASSGDFPQRAWAPEHWASVVLAEAITIPLAGRKLAWSAWHTGQERPPVTHPTAREIEDLEALVEYRPAVMAEAMAQKDAILQYYTGILSFNRRSHPATIYLCIAGLRLASFIVMYWKEYFNRARPSSISAKLMPPIDPPGHASFPSGHATQAHLVARLLWEVMPKQIVPADKFKEGPLYLMAERIGRNREVLGLHYRSDTLAGEALAEHITTKILLDRRATKAAALIDAAKTEWVR